MASNQDIHQLTFTCGVDMQAVNDQVGPLVLSTTKPYRMRRNMQRLDIRRRIDPLQKTNDTGSGNMGTLGVLPVEVMCLIFSKMNIQTFFRMKGVCKSIKVIAEHSNVQKTLEYISAAEPKSLGMIMKSRLGWFYTISYLDVFFETTCSQCYGYGDGIFLPTMTRICIDCSENTSATSCICMTTAIDKYSITESQILEARIPLLTNAIPNGNLKLLPEILVRGYALRYYGSMEGIEQAFEMNKELKMKKYNLQCGKWEREVEVFRRWVEATESILGADYSLWPREFMMYYGGEKDKLKRRKPKLPRQTFEVNFTHIAGREAGTAKYLTRKAKIIDRYTGASERFCYCLGCRKDLLPIPYLSIREGGTRAEVKAARQPYLDSQGDLFKHQVTCPHVEEMRREHQKLVVVAVKQAIEIQQTQAIAMHMAMEF